MILLALALPLLAKAQTSPDMDLIDRFDALQAGYAISLDGEVLIARQTLRRFYEREGFRLVWTDADQRRALADAVLALDGDGLNPQDYHGPLLDQLAQTPDDELTDGHRADRDLLYTDAFLMAASHLAQGKVNPESIHAEWTAARPQIDLAEALAQALASGDPADALNRLRPNNEHYHRLMRARERLAALADAPWPVLPPGPAIKPGSTDERLVAIRDRLMALGDLHAVTTDADAGDPLADPMAYDLDLEAAVRRFQARHGLDDDGVIGKGTLAALNLSPKARIDQIDASLERWRWLPDSLGENYVLVNIAGFNLALVQGGQTVLASRVIVGRPYRQTPVFSDQIRYLVLNPTWTVPRKLMIQDQLPMIRKDPSYFSRLNMQVYSGWGADRQRVDPQTIDWGALSKNHFPYQLVQGPGALNALGRVKFMFPNKYDVYLHDTPARELFGKSSRGFSSGCIRVEKAAELAQQLLGWSGEQWSDALQEANTRTVMLPAPLPVHIQYWTAWVDDAGVIQFRDDLYERDPRLLQQLHQAPREAG